MKLPYGISNFGDLRRQGCRYVDKTAFIPLLEDLSTGAAYLIFLRPRRFGKSVLVSTLAHYYDITRAGEFDALFGDLAVAGSPTPGRNAFLVMSLDLSGMAGAQGPAGAEPSIGTVFASYLRNVREAIGGFIRRYAALLPDAAARWAAMDQAEDPATLMRQFLYNLAPCPYQIYLLVDEYDSFANDLIARGLEKDYEDIVHSTGFVRQFYQVVKEGTHKGIIGRIFMTGISPITMDDLASSANIFFNITLDDRFNAMTGFTAPEVATLTEDALASPPLSLDRDELFMDLRHYYNGYLFSAAAHERLYNPEMVLYFLKHLRPPDRYPEKLLDVNLRMDHGRMRSLLVAPDGRPRARSIEVIQTLLTERFYDGILDDAFPLVRAFDDQYFASHLFYLGLLTIESKQIGMMRFVVPNYVIEQLHYQTLSQILGDVAQVSVDRTAIAGPVARMAREGDIEPFLRLVYEEVIRKLSKRDLLHASEKSMKFILLAWLSLSDVFHPFSELEMGGGYSDLILTPNRNYAGASHSFLLELKYIKETEATEAKVAALLAEADRQLARYRSDPRLPAAAGAAGWKAFSLVFVGTRALYVRELGQNQAIALGGAVRRKGRAKPAARRAPGRRRS